jgi:hypothetical protein
MDTTVRVPKRLAKMLACIARSRGVSVSTLCDDMLRQPILIEYRKVISQEKAAIEKEIAAKKS